MQCPTPHKKGRYTTRADAESAARRREPAAGRPLTAYTCEPGCGWWHLTSNPHRPTDTVTPIEDPAVTDTVTHMTDDIGDEPPAWWCVPCGESGMADTPAACRCPDGRPRH